MPANRKNSVTFKAKCVYGYKDIGAFSFQILPTITWTKIHNVLKHEEKTKGRIRKRIKNFSYHHNYFVNWINLSTHMQTYGTKCTTYINFCKSELDTKNWMIEKFSENWFILFEDLRNNKRISSWIVFLLWFDYVSKEKIVGNSHDKSNCNKKWKTSYVKNLTSFCAYLCKVRTQTSWKRRARQILVKHQPG